MIIRDKTNSNIERHKQKLGLKGDIYIINDILIESLDSHKILFPDSTAKTIEEAETERIAYENELKAKAATMSEDENFE